MEKQCTHEHCWAPDVSCAMGDDYRNCKNFKADRNQTDTGQNLEGDYPLPWSGNSLGLDDLQFIAARSIPNMVGLVGSYNAGKTTLLTAIYLLLGQGRHIGDRLFSGSLTFEGWESLAYDMRWKAGDPPCFPPHTSFSSGRIPGLLHFSFRDKSELLEDVIFTDAPGEWFDRWGIDRNAPDAEGAQWISRYAQTFILFADSEALSGSQLGEARSKLMTLAERLSGEVAGRPVAIVWSKSDKEIQDGVRKALSGRFEKLFPVKKEFSISVVLSNGENSITEFEILSLLCWLVSAQDRSDYYIRELPIKRSEDPLLAFRGR